MMSMKPNTAKVVIECWISVRFYFQLQLPLPFLSSVSPDEGRLIWTLEFLMMAFCGGEEDWRQG
jgi:hypothetical protein